MSENALKVQKQARTSFLGEVTNIDLKARFWTKKITKRKKSSFDVSQSTNFDQILYSLSYFPKMDLFISQPRSFLDRELPLDISELWRGLLDAEKGADPKIVYMSKQTEINQGMRTMLIDWLISVVHEFNLNCMTMALFVDIIDRYSSKYQVTVKKYQLLGAAALLVACKYGEVNFPPLKQIASITENAFTDQEVKQMELHLMIMLGFSITFPLSFEFFDICAVKLRFSKEMYTVGELILKLAAVKYKFTKYRNSVLGISAALLVHRTCYPDELTDFVNMQNITSLCEICYCSSELKDMCSESTLKHSEIVKYYDKDGVSRAFLKLFSSNEEY